MKILLSGGAGDFCSQLIKYNYEHVMFAPSREEMDVTDISQVENKIVATKPDVFIHAAAISTPMADHECYPEKSLKINILGTSNVVLSCMKYDVKLVYISTNYVYPGTEGDYLEEDPIKPINKYGWSKLGGECAVKLYNKSLILRMCMQKKPFPHSRALVDVMSSFIFNDKAARITLELLDEVGIINVGGPRRSVYDFAREDSPTIGKISYKEIDDVGIGIDSSINTNKLKNILDGL